MSGLCFFLGLANKAGYARAKAALDRLEADGLVESTPRFSPTAHGRVSVHYRLAGRR